LYRKEAGLIADDDFFLRVGQFTDVIEISKPLASFREHKQSATARLESLSHRLAIDYLFQTRHYHSHTSLLVESDIGLIQDQAIRFINSYFAESLLKNDIEALQEARKLRVMFEDVVVGYFGKKSPVEARLLWILVEKMQPSSLGIGILSIILRMLMIVRRQWRTGVSNMKSIRYGS